MCGATIKIVSPHNLIYGDISLLFLGRFQWLKYSQLHCREERAHTHHFTQNEKTFLFLGAFEKLQKATSGLVMSGLPARLSVRQHGTTRLHWT